MLPPGFGTLAELVHCEGVALSPDGMLYTGDEQGRIFRIDPAGGSHEQVADIEAWALGIACDGDGRVYVAAVAPSAVFRVDPPSGEVDRYCETAEGGAIPCPNFPVFAPDGSLYLSDSGTEDYAVRDGRLLWIPPGGGDAQVLETGGPLHFPNGLALAHDGTLYVLESFTPRVLAYRDGELSVHADLPRTVPDGLALTGDGGMVVACYQPNTLLYVPPGGGRAEVFADDWTGQKLLTPTNACFYGPELDRLAIASLCGYRLTTVPAPWQGQPLFYPKLEQATAR